jgi:putative membrane protein
MWWGIHDGIGWWMVFGGVWMLLFWAAIIGLVVWGIRAITGSTGSPVNLEEPLEIARRRYSRGEITKEQFEEIRATLRQVQTRP